MAIISEVFGQALMISGFVFTMMLVIEYVNVLSHGFLQNRFRSRGWQPYLFAALMGVLPGCLGAFTVVAMYTHRMLSFGALVTAMIATSGDEMFVMLALFPQQALLLSLILFVVGIGVGVLSDRFAGRSGSEPDCEGFSVHQQVQCRCFPAGKIWQQLRHNWRFRLLPAALLLFLAAAVLASYIGPASWNWMRISLLATSLFALFIVLTVPDHFLQEHLWRHVVRQHVPRIFAWTMGTLLLLELLLNFVDLHQLIEANPWTVLLVAVSAGLIPQSGPHLVFVTLFAGGTLPFSVLLASSITQDGHGMLPLLAHSRSDFIKVKVFKMLVGFLAGAVLLLAGV